MVGSAAGPIRLRITDVCVGENNGREASLFSGLMSADGPLVMPVGNAGEENLRISIVGWGGGLLLEADDPVPDC